MQISRISQHNFNTLSAKPQRAFNPKSANVKFTGGMPESSFFAPLKKLFKPVTAAVKSGADSLVNSITRGYSKIIETKFFKNMVAKTAKNKIDVVKHLSATIGLIISGLYIKRTLANDKLAPEQKTTLAINQGIVSATATTLGYSVEGLTRKKIDIFARKYSAVNYKSPGLKSLQGGIKAATQMMIFATMYRYIAPVLVTPIANTIGNNIQAKKKAAAAAAKSQVQSQSNSAPAVDKVA